MGDKKSRIIILVLVVALVLIIGLIIGILMSDSSVDSEKGGNTPDVYVEEPIITLNKEINEEDDSIVTITAYASTENEEEITCILLPDGTEVPGATATYTVTENGVYIFEATSISGGTAVAEVEVTEIPEISAANPYVPKGFTVISDNVDEGFVVADEFDNQYVWVPVESGKLKRETMLDINYEESSGSASALVNSVAKYYGFYIGRFEASQYEHDGEVTAATMAGKIPWTNITQVNAAEHAENSGKVFGYADCSTALISSHAWDTVIGWVDLVNENYSSDVNFGNYSGTIYPTGTTTTDSVRNVCDLAGNVREWTTEVYKGDTTVDQNSPEYATQRVVRGGSANLKRTPISHIPYPENTSDNYWGFRLVLYK